MLETIGGVQSLVPSQTRTFDQPVTDSGGARAESFEDLGPDVWPGAGGPGLISARDILVQTCELLCAETT